MLSILCMHTQVFQRCLTLCDPMDCSLPGFSVHGISFRQEYWSGLSFLSPEDHPDPGIELYSLLHLLKWQADYLPLSHLRSPVCSLACNYVEVCVYCV